MNATTKDESIKTVHVYKYDGSRQCEKDTGIAVEDMAKELKDIRIISSQHRTDGMMHPQVCHAPTGMVNIYEIGVDDLDQALKLGFKQWKK